MTRKLNVTIDKDLCVSNQWCIKNVPGVFAEDSNGQADVVNAEGADEADIVEAAYNCPVGAISVTDAQTGEDVLG